MSHRVGEQRAPGFWPLAIPAIINASKVNPLLQQGNFAEASAVAHSEATHATTLATLQQRMCSQRRSGPVGRFGRRSRL